MIHLLALPLANQAIGMAKLLVWVSISGRSIPCLVPWSEDATALILQVSKIGILHVNSFCQETCAGYSKHLLTSQSQSDS